MTKTNGMINILQLWQLVVLQLLLEEEEQSRIWAKKKQPLLQSEETDRSASYPNDTGDKDMEFAIQLQIMGLFAVLPN